MSDEAVIFPMTLAGREIKFKRPVLGQVLILQRLFHRQMKANESGDVKGDAMTTVIMKTLDFIDTLVIEDEDRQFIEDQMLAGVIDWQEIMGVLSGGMKDKEEADDEAPKPIKRAPRKSPKAAKTVVSRARAQR